jgi:hypothetical protein
MIHCGLRGTKVGSPWSIKPALKSGLDIAPNPKLSPRFGERTRSRVFRLSMSSGAGKKETRIENILAGCAGLEVHVRRIEANGRVHSETRHWGSKRRISFKMFCSRSTRKVYQALDVFAVTAVAQDSVGYTLVRRGRAHLSFD